MKALRSVLALFDDTEDPAEPRYDPTHLATVLVSCMVVAGVLFWLLWTLLVYEGGLPSKLSALASGANRPDALEGLGANLVALALTSLVVALLYRAERRAVKK